MAAATIPAKTNECTILIGETAAIDGCGIEVERVSAHVFRFKIPASAKLVPPKNLARNLAER